MGVRGDFEELAKLRRKMSEPNSEIKEPLLKAAAAEARTLVAMEFRQSIDPNGDPWQPLAWRKGMPLRKTGRGANSFTARPTDEGFVVGTNVEYMAFHQTGGKTRQARGKKSRTKVGRLPKREIVPSGGRLTARWLLAIEKALTPVARRIFKG